MLVHHDVADPGMDPEGFRNVPTAMVVGRDCHRIGQKRFRSPEAGRKTVGELELFEGVDALVRGRSDLGHHAPLGRQFQLGFVTRLGREKRKQGAEKTGLPRDGLLARGRGASGEHEDGLPPPVKNCQF